MFKKLRLISLMVLVSCSSAPFVPTDNSNESINKVIDSRMTEFRNCYRPVMRQDPEKKGKVVLSWELDEAGKTKDAKVSSAEFQDEAANKCFVDVLSATQFAPGGKEKGVKFSVGINFSNYTY